MDDLKKDISHIVVKLWITKGTDNRTLKNDYMDRKYLLLAWAEFNEDIKGSMTPESGPEISDDLDIAALEI